MVKLAYSSRNTAARPLVRLCRRRLTWPSIGSDGVVAKDEVYTWNFVEGSPEIKSGWDHHCYPLVMSK